MPEWKTQRSGGTDSSVSDDLTFPLLLAVKSHWFWVLIIALASLVRLIGIDQQSIWVDEAFSIKYAHLYDQLTGQDLINNLHGPLHALVLHFWAMIFGKSVLALRFPSLLISIATIPVFWLMARARWGSSVAWTGTVLLSLSPFHIWYAQEVRNYAFLFFMAVLNEYHFTRLRQGGATAGRLLLYGFSLLFGFLSNLAMFFILIPQGLGLLGLRRNCTDTGEIETRRWRTPIRVSLIWVLVALALSPWIINFYQNRLVDSSLVSDKPEMEQIVLREKAESSPMILPYTFYVFGGGYSLGPARREMKALGPWEALRRDIVRVAATGLVIGLLWVSGLIAAWRRNRSWAIDLFLWQVLPILLLLFLAMQSVKVVNPRYVAIAHPAFLATLAFNCYWRRKGVIGLSLLCLVFLFADARGYLLERYHKTDHQTSAIWLGEQITPDDLVFGGGGVSSYREYYLRDNWRVPGEQHWQIKQFYPSNEPTFLEHYNNVILPLWLPGQRLFTILIDTPESDWLNPALSRDGDLLEEKRWHGVHVVVYVRRGTLDEQ